MDYIMAVQAPAYWLSETSFATESAFAQHLRELRKSIGPRFSRLVLIAPQIPQHEYLAKQQHLGVVTYEADGVVYLPAYPNDASVREFWNTHARRIWRMVSGAVQNAGLVHSGMSTDLYRPFMAMVNLAGWRAKLPVVFVVDIDFRQHTKRFYSLGKWGLKSYIVNRLLHDPLKCLQVWLAVRMYDLVLLKSASMVRDFGKGRRNVKNFYDTVHSVDDTLSEDAERAHLEKLKQPGPLSAVYFGRLVEYKGLDRAIEAVRLARRRGADVRLTLIGDGECRPALERQVQAAGLQDAVTFAQQVSYGASLFERLAGMHLTVATPLIEDTPRAAFDSMARGLPLLAFDISYFRDLAQESGAVALATWPDPSALAQQLFNLSRDRETLAAMAARGLAFARNNTQVAWLEQRASWIRDLTAGVPVPA